MLRKGTQNKYVIFEGILFEWDSGMLEATEK